MHFLLDTKEDRQRQLHADRSKRWRDALKNNPEKAEMSRALARQKYALQSNDENVVEKRREKWRKAAQKRRLQSNTRPRPLKILTDQNQNQVKQVRRSGRLLNMCSEESSDPMLLVSCEYNDSDKENYDSLIRSNHMRNYATSPYSLEAPNEVGSEHCSMPVTGNGYEVTDRGTPSFSFSERTDKQVLRSFNQFINDENQLFSSLPKETGLTPPSSPSLSDFSLPSPLSLALEDPVAEVSLSSSSLKGTDISLTASTTSGVFPLTSLNCNFIEDPEETQRSSLVKGAGFTLIASPSYSVCPLTSPNRNLIEDPEEETPVFPILAKGTVFTLHATPHPLTSPNSYAFQYEDMNDSQTSDFETNYVPSLSDASEAAYELGDIGNSLTSILENGSDVADQDISNSFAFTTSNPTESNQDSSSEFRNHIQTPTCFLSPDSSRTSTPFPTEGTQHVYSMLENAERSFDATISMKSIHTSTPISLPEPAKGNTDCYRRLSSRKRKISEPVKAFLNNGGKLRKNKRNDLYEVRLDPVIKTKIIIKSVSIAGKRRAKVYRDNSKLKKENTALKRKVEKFKKRYYRLVQKVKLMEQPLSLEVDKIIGRHKVPSQIKDKLLEGVVLQTHLKSYYNIAKKYKEKQVLRKIFYGSANNIFSKYKKLTFMRSFAPKRNRKTNETGQPTSKLLRKREDVHKFLQLDSSSAMTSGKKETITRCKIKKQRRYLLKDLKELHKEFQLTVTYEINYSSFCQLKPFWVLFPDLSRRETCACVTHDNMELIVNKLHRENIISENTISKLINEIVCDRKQQTCMSRKCNVCKNKLPVIKPHLEERTIEYQRWQNTTRTYEVEEKQANGSVKVVEKTSKFMAKATLEVTCAELVTLLQANLSKFLQHVFRADYQFEVLHHKRNNLSPDQLHFWWDFGMNWVTKYAKEVQSVHWGAGRTQITVHASISYSCTEKQAACTLSANRNHGPWEIMAHMIPIIRSAFNKQQLQEYHLSMQSDSPSAQYRNQLMFALLVQVFPKLFPEVKSLSWNYTESGHGKGGVDGVSAAVKCHADDIVAKGSDVDTFEKFLACSQQLENVLIDSVSDSDIRNVKKMRAVSKKFLGTTKVHQLTWSRDFPETVYFNSLSCFQCPPGTRCEHHYLGRLDFSTPAPKSPRNTSPSIPFSPPEVEQAPAPKSPRNSAPSIPFSPEVEEAPAPKSPRNSSPSIPFSPPEVEEAEAVLVAREPEENLSPTRPAIPFQPTAKSYVAICLGNQYYPGFVISVQKSTANIKVMMKTEKMYYYCWPVRQDLRKNVPFSKLRSLLEDPVQEGKYFKFDFHF